MAETIADLVAHRLPRMLVSGIDYNDAQAVLARQFPRVTRFEEDRSAEPDRRSSGGFRARQCGSGDARECQERSAVGDHGSH